MVKRAKSAGNQIYFSPHCSYFLHSNFELYHVDGIQILKFIVRQIIYMFPNCTDIMKYADIFMPMQLQTYKTTDNLSV